MLKKYLILSLKQATKNGITRENPFYNKVTKWILVNHVVNQKIIFLVSFCYNLFAWNFQNNEITEESIVVIRIFNFLLVATRFFGIF